MKFRYYSPAKNRLQGEACLARQGFWARCTVPLHPGWDDQSTPSPKTRPSWRWCGGCTTTSKKLYSAEPGDQPELRRALVSKCRGTACRAQLTLEFDQAGYEVLNKIPGKVCLRARHASPGKAFGHGTPCPYTRVGMIGQDYSQRPGQVGGGEESAPGAIKSGGLRVLDVGARRAVPN